VAALLLGVCVCHSGAVTWCMCDTNVQHLQGVGPRPDLHACVCCARFPRNMWTHCKRVSGSPDCVQGSSLLHAQDLQLSKVCVLAQPLRTLTGPCALSLGTFAASDL
jgi:hypothetical protein